MNWENLGQNLLIWAGQFGVKILGTILFWVVGRALIGLAPGQFLFLKNTNSAEAVPQTSVSAAAH